MNSHSHEKNKTAKTRHMCGHRYPVSELKQIAERKKNTLRTELAFLIEFEKKRKKDRKSFPDCGSVSSYLFLQSEQQQLWCARFFATLTRQCFWQQFFFTLALFSLNLNDSLMPTILAFAHYCRMHNNFDHGNRRAPFTWNFPFRSSTCFLFALS